MTDRIEFAAHLAIHYHGPASELLFGRVPEGEVVITHEADGVHYRIKGWVDPESQCAVITGVDRERGTITYEGVRK